MQTIPTRPVLLAALLLGGLSPHAKPEADKLARTVILDETP